MSSCAAVVDKEESSRKAASAFYRPGLDILRVVAFFLVFLAHGLVTRLDQPTQLGAIGRAGEFGVCIFFFLSSYLITELLLREKHATKTVAIPAFYVRRVLRIWPLYFAMIGLSWFYGLFSATHSISATWLAALMLLFTNWYTVGHGYPPGFLFPLWSISIEEQFYLLWPGIVKFASPAWLLGISAMLMVFAYATMAWLLARGASLDPGLWANSLVQFQFFALGTMTAVMVRGRVPCLPKVVRWGLLVAGLACLRGAQAAAYTHDPVVAHDFAHIAPRYLVALVGCLCLFFSCLPMGGGGWQKPFIYLGKISYGLYVFHVMWLGVARALLKHFAGANVTSFKWQLLAMAIALPGTVVTGMLSYRYLESPFLRFKKRFTVVRSRPV